MIEFDELSVSHDGRLALGPLTGRIGPGATAIVGPAQSGKTTLLKALCALIEPSRGRLSVDGEELWALPAERRAAVQGTFGMVFQSDALFDSLDALENVALPLLRRGVPRRDAAERAREALAQVGLTGQEQTLPERLSGGMRKRLGLARAIVARPRWLLADEPFAGLDPGTTTHVLELLFGLWRDRGGLIIAAADPAPLWDRCDQVLVLDQGRLTAAGPPSQVRAVQAARRDEERPR